MCWGAHEGWCLRSGGTTTTWWPHASAAASASVSSSCCVSRTQNLQICPRSDEFFANSSQPAQVVNIGFETTIVYLAFRHLQLVCHIVQTLCPLVHLIFGGRPSDHVGRSPSLAIFSLPVLYQQHVRTPGRHRRHQGHRHHVRCFSHVMFYRITAHHGEGGQHAEERQIDFERHSAICLSHIPFRFNDASHAKNQCHNSNIAWTACHRYKVTIGACPSWTCSYTWDILIKHRTRCSQIG